jgi:hypothetical protein
MSQITAPNYIHEVVIPFSGFYESWHDDNIKHAIEELVQDTDGVEYEDLAQALHECCTLPYAEMRAAYAREYAEHMSHKLTQCDGLGSVVLTYQSLDSPREYNFMTDRIVATITTRGVGALYSHVIDNCLTDFQCKVIEQCTSRDGFHSHYDNDYTTWGIPLEWDHNQLGILIEAALDHEFAVSWTPGSEHIEEMVRDIMYDSVRNIVWDCLRIDDYPDWAKVQAIIAEADQRRDAE